MWGIVPAAGAGARIQPLAFGKELLPVGSRMEERPLAVSEYLVDRMLATWALEFFGAGESCRLLEVAGSGHFMRDPPMGGAENGRKAAIPLGPADADGYRAGPGLAPDRALDQGCRTTPCCRGC